MIRIQSFFITIFFGVSPLLGSQFPAEPLIKASFTEHFLHKINSTPIPPPSSLCPIGVGLTMPDELCNVTAPHTAYFIVQKNEMAALPSQALPQNLWKGWNILGSGSLLQRIKRTETNYGTAVLSHMLIEPVGASVIAQRQRVLEVLLNSADHKKIKASLQKIHTLEAHLVRWYAHLAGLKNLSIHPTLAPDFQPAPWSIVSTMLPVCQGLYGAMGTGAAVLAIKAREPVFGVVSGMLFSITSLMYYMHVEHQKVLRTTQAILMAVAQIIEETTQITQILGNNRTLREFREFQELFALLDASQQSKYFKNLVELLQSNTFKGTPSYWSRDSKIMQARLLLVESQNEIKSLLRGVGIVDAYASIASLIRSQQNAPCPYTFVQFVDDEKPMLSLLNFWSPFEDDPNPTSIECGRSHPQNTVMMGENSDHIQMIGTCVLLAHTFGIAPAYKATMSHFDVFHTCRTSDHYGLSDRLAKITVPQQHALVLYQEDKEVPFDQFVKIVAPQLAQSEQYMMIATAKGSPPDDKSELTKLGFFTICYLGRHFSRP